MIEIRPSARRHGRSDRDIRWAMEHALVVADVDVEVARGDVIAALYLGPDTNGDLIEVVVIEDDQGDEIAIHAMKMRKRYRYLLPGVGS